MFRLVKVNGGSIVAVYRKKRSGETDYFGSTYAEKDKRVPVLWGYKYAVFDTATVPLEAECDVKFSDGAAVVTVDGNIGVTEWSAKNAIDKILGQDFDECVESARQALIKAVTESAKQFTLDRANKKRAELEFEISRTGNIEITELGLTLTAVRVAGIAPPNNKDE